MNGKKAKMLRKVAKDLAPRLEADPKKLYNELKKDYLRRKQGHVK